MFDFLAMLNVFDWLDGLRGRLHHWRRGVGTTSILFSPPAGQSAQQVERYLHRYGIRVSGRGLAGQQVVNGKKAYILTLQVSSRQARYARAMLRRAGCELQ